MFLHAGGRDQPAAPARVQPFSPQTRSLLERATPVQVWRAADGSTAAVGYVVSGWCWMRWPGYLTFRLALDGSSAVPFTERDVPDDDVADLWRRSVLAHQLVLQGHEALHASAVLGPRGVVAFCGRSGVGKSTLAHALTTRGFTQFADDVVVLRIETSEGRASALPLPYRVRLRDDDAPSEVVTPPDAYDGEAHWRSAPPMQAVAILERTSNPDAPNASIAHVEGSAALLAVLEHAHAFDPGDAARRRTMTQALLALVAGTPVLRIQFRPGPDALPDLLDAVAQTVAGGE